MNDKLSQNATNLLLELWEASEQVDENIHETSEENISIRTADLLGGPLDDIPWELLDQADYLHLERL